MRPLWVGRGKKKVGAGKRFLRGPCVISDACPRALELCATVAGCLSLMLLGPSLARANQSHRFSFSFGGCPEPQRAKGECSAAGQLSLVSGSPSTAGSGVAVNAETHDVYVADTTNDRVDEFKADGTFVRAWGWGVADGTSKELQTCTLTCFKGLPGISPGELEAPTFVAVDNSAGPSHGDVYVAGPGQSGESPSNLVTKFTSEGALLESWGKKGQLDGSIAPEGPFGELAGVAVSGSGNLWIYVGGTAHAPNNHFYEFDQSGAFTQSCLANSGNSGGYSPQGLAIDGSENLYVGENGTSANKDSCSSRVMLVQAPLTGLALDPLLEDSYFDEASAILDLATGQRFGEGQLSAAAGLGVDSSTGAVYAANTALDQVAAFAVGIEATIQPAGEVLASSATLHGKVDPEGAELTRCKFEYGETEAFGHNVPCEESFAEIGTGTKPVEVKSPVTDLAGGKSYDFRLRATNANGDLRSEKEAFTTLATAVIEEPSATEVTGSSALLGAKVNPEGVAETTCTIEYGQTTAYGTSLPCEPPEPSGSSPVAISLHLGGLSPETTYHWRVVVKDHNGTVQGPDNTFIDLAPEPPPGSCPNEALRAESLLNPKTGFALSSGLPDCRAYEVVTPAQKNAALLSPIFLGLVPQLSDNGERVIGSSIQCFSEPGSCTGDRASKGPPFEFARTGGGWQTHPLAPPASSFEINSVWGYDANTDMVLYSSPVPSHVTDEFYAREPGGTFEGIGPIGENSSFQKIDSSPLQATGDLSHVVYESDGLPLWPKVEGSKGESLYEYAGFGSNGPPILVGVSGGAGSNELISACGTALGAPKGPAVNEALSADGRTVYFTAFACPEGTGANKGTPVPANELYARVDGELPDAHTVAVSHSQCGAGAQPNEVECRADEAHPSAAWLEGVSEDGSKALFSSTQKLDDGASEDAKGGDTADKFGCSRTSGANGCNLYLYDLAGAPGANLIDVSGGDSSGLGPQVQGVMALSADGSRVYFVAKGVLTAGKNQAGAEPLEGADNLYVYERDAAHPSGRTAFIATLPGFRGTPPKNEADETEQWTRRSGPAANVTPDGRVLVFTSHGALTPDTSGEGSAQVYRYDAQNEQLMRISIGRRGFHDNGNAAAGEARIVLPEGNVGPPRRDPTMSNDGSYVFFQSPAGLTPGALENVPVNAQGESSDLAQNVYEWEAEGKGGCAQAGGCVSLISDGRDIAEGHSGRSFATASAVELLGSDASGENVFFATVDPLVGQDTDSQLDFYDARVGGGFPAPVEQPFCQGEECKEPPPGPPVFGALGSMSFSGPGNLPATVVKPPTKPPASPLTNAQKLAKAMKLCHAKKNRRRRALCEREARRRYGARAKLKARKGSRRTRPHGRHR